MKKLVLGILVLSVILSACSKDTQKKEDQNSNEDKIIEISNAQNSYGIYYKTNLDSGLTRIDYFDFESQSSQPLCTKSNCLHKDESCPAIELTTYKDGTLISMGSNDKNVYYIFTADIIKENKDTGMKDYAPSLFLAKSDLDGSNLSIVYQAPEDRVYQGYAYIYEDHLFYPFSGIKYLDDQKKISINSSAIQLACVDLVSKEEDVISNKDKQDLAYTSIYGFIDNKVYYSELKQEEKIGVDPVAVKTYDFKTKETGTPYEECLITNSRIINNKIYGYDGIRNKYISFDLKTGKQVDLKEGPVLKDNTNIFSADGIINISTSADITSTAELYTYDAIEGKELDASFYSSRRVDQGYLIFGKDGYEITESS